MKKHKWFRLTLVVIFTIIVLLVVIATLFDFFTPSVEKTTYEFGCIGVSLPCGTNQVNQYAMLVTYTSKGAFIAGQKIHVNVYFYPNGNKKIFDNTDVVVAFPDATFYPAPKNIEGISDAWIQPKFVNDSVAQGEADIVYQMPEPQGISAVVNIDTKDMFTYGLMFNKTPQMPGTYARKGGLLHVAPLETSVAIKTNSYLLAIAIITIYVSALQLLATIEGK